MTRNNAAHDEEQTTITADTAADLEAGDTVEVEYESKFSDSRQSVRGEVTATTVTLDSDDGHLLMTLDVDTEDGRRRVSLSSSSHSDTLMVEVSTYRSSHDRMNADGSLSACASTTQQISERATACTISRIEEVEADDSDDSDEDEQQDADTATFTTHSGQTTIEVDSSNEVILMDGEEQDGQFEEQRATILDMVEADALIRVDEADDDPREPHLGTPQRAGVDTFADEQPREPCNRCGGEAVHVVTNTVNGWINDASAYDDHHYECPDCGSTGQVTENGERAGCIAVPQPSQSPEGNLI